MAAKNTIIFTKRGIEQLLPPSNGLKQLQYFDDKVRGLCVQVSPTGMKTFYARRKIQGKNERLYIGRFPDVSVEQARVKAEEFQSKLSKGDNLADVRREQNKEMTLQDLFEQYKERHLVKKSKRIDDITKTFDRGFSHWKNRRLSTISPDDVMDLHQEIADTRGPLAANRAVEIIRAMYNKGIKWRLYRGENPATIVTMFPENIRTRILGDDEFENLQQALDEERNTDMRDFFWLALLTGVRKTNLLSMRWEDLNLDTKLWKIPQEKTKTGEPYIVALTDTDVEILRQRQNQGEYVFPGNSKEGRMVEPKRAWARVLKRAGIKDLRLHDLRRSMGSWMANSGANASLIRGALNHKDIKTTLTVYAHSTKNSEREAKEKAFKKLRRQEPRHSSNVLQFNKKMEF